MIKFTCLIATDVSFCRSYIGFLDVLKLNHLWSINSSAQITISVTIIFTTNKIINYVVDSATAQIDLMAM